ncbi:MAG: hypothetical protein H7A38_05775 [Chlamydiales bacterium]|nr:hypothetical protein [Chlamydiales bacterium]
MHDLPQQPADGQVILPIEVGEKDPAVIREGISYEIIERPTPTESKLEEKDLYAMAHYLKAKYAKGFTWKELPDIIQELVLFIGPNPTMSFKEKRVAALETLHYLLVSIDSLYLPEKATEPFFEEMIPHFLYLAFTFPKEASLLKANRVEPFSHEELMNYADELFAYFDGDLCWKTLSQATNHALKLALSLSEATLEEREHITLMVLEAFLKNGEPTHLPADYDEKIFTRFIKSYIRVLLCSSSFSTSILP